MLAEDLTGRKFGKLNSVKSRLTGKNLIKDWLKPC